MTLSTGTVVRNFSTIAKVVGQHPTGPVLREVSFTGKLRGGKWVADPAKCDVLSAGEREAFFSGDAWTALCIAQGTSKGVL